MLPMLAALDAQDRLKTPYAPYGVTPGEAAAFVVIERAADAAARGARPLCAIRALGTADGPPLASPPRNDGARALCEAMAAATRGANALRDRMTVVCDLNGEPHRAIEWGLARSRVLRFARGSICFTPPTPSARWGRRPVGCCSGWPRSCWSGSSRRRATSWSGPAVTTARAPPFI